MEKLKLSRDVAKAITWAQERFTNHSILEAHKRNPKGWILKENEALNQIDYGTLQKALVHGYEIEDESNYVSLNDLKIGMEIRILSGVFKNDIFIIKDIDLVNHKIMVSSGFVSFHNQGTGWEVVGPQPLTQKSSQQALEAELDYELASLYDAMQRGNQVEIKRSKKRLKEIYEELELESVLEGF